MLEISWVLFKSFVDSRSMYLQYIDDGTAYFIWASDGMITPQTRVIKNGSSDQTDFETNYKTNANNCIPTRPNTYSSSFVGLLTGATNTTDIFTLAGSASKTVRILEISITGYRTTSAGADILLIKRSTGNTGGTGFPLTYIPHDSNNPAPTTTAVAWSVSPTLGTAVGVIRAQKMFLNAAATGVSDKIVWNFGSSLGQALILRGGAQQLSVNLNGATILGGTFDIYITWVEE